MLLLSWSFLLIFLRWFATCAYSSLPSFYSISIVLKSTAPHQIMIPKPFHVRHMLTSTLVYDGHVPCTAGYRVRWPCRYGAGR